MIEGTEGPALDPVDRFRTVMREAVANVKVPEELADTIVANVGHSAIQNTDPMECAKERYRAVIALDASGASTDAVTEALEGFTEESRVEGLRRGRCQNCPVEIMASLHHGKWNIFQAYLHAEDVPPDGLCPAELKVNPLIAEARNFADGLERIPQAMGEAIIEFSRETGPSE